MLANSTSVKRMVKEKSDRNYDMDGFKKRAACVCVKNDNENENSLAKMYANIEILSHFAILIDLKNSTNFKSDFKTK